MGRLHVISERAMVKNLISRRGWAIRQAIARQRRLEAWSEAEGMPAESPDFSPQDAFDVAAFYLARLERCQGVAQGLLREREERQRQMRVLRKGADREHRRGSVEDGGALEGQPRTLPGADERAGDAA